MSGKNPKHDAFLREERDRLIRYQNQHRGLGYIQLWLPPSTDEKVNIIGVDGHIYKGTVPFVPNDEFPKDQDPRAIDEEKLYKEIRDYRFPPVPPQETLGPSRRIGGSYTKTKQLHFAPVQLKEGKDYLESPTIRMDGKVYHGVEKTQEQKPDNDKEPEEVAEANSSEFLKPTVVCLHSDGEPTLASKLSGENLIMLPMSELKKVMTLVKKTNLTPEDVERELLGKDNSESSDKEEPADKRTGTEEEGNQEDSVVDAPKNDMEKQEGDGLISTEESKLSEPGNSTDPNVNLGEVTGQETPKPENPEVLQSDTSVSSETEGSGISETKESEQNKTDTSNTSDESESVTESSAPESSAAEPSAAESSAAESSAADPTAAEPSAAESSAAESPAPESSAPQSSDPGSSETESSAINSSEPEPSELKSSEPPSSETEPSEPESSAPSSSESA